MEERLPIYQNGVRAGDLLRREEGLHTVFLADCPRGQGEGLRKVWLCGDGAERVLLGTLAPEGSRWRLTRRLARSGLERAGLTGDIWGEIDQTQTGSSQPGAEPPRNALPVRPCDPVIADALAAERPGRWQRVGDCWQVTYPWQQGQPMPLLPLFCFARVGRGEVTFLLNGRGYPVAER
ncbi:MAG: hypothetical protein LUC30_06300 [Clostridiales bacterium]|nr:hypothetical protein [Clostridiales bacterium]